MKRKYLSALLMGALTVTSVSTFTSCKDYDSDISALRADVDKKALLDDVKAMQATVEAAKTTAEAAKAAAEKAQGGVDLTEIKDKTEKLGTEVADAVKTGKDAKAVADSAYAKCSDLEKKFAEYYTAEKVDNLLKELEEKINGDGTSFDELKKTVESYSSNINKLYSAVTGVSLVVGNSTTGTAFDDKLTFKVGTIATADSKDFTFGEKEIDDLKGEHSADPKYTYVNGAQISFPEEILVRVNPVNAVVTKDMIKFVDSKGGDLNSMVEVESVTKFDQYLTKSTRASETGLWIVKLQLKKPYSKTAIQQKDNNKDIAFAVAVNNTASQNAEGAEDRWVVSDYQLTIDTPTDYKKTSNNLATMYANAERFGTPTTDKDGYPLISVQNGEDIVVSMGTSGLQTQVDRFYVVRDDEHAKLSGSSEYNGWTKYQYEGLNQIVEVANGVGKDTIRVTIPADAKTGDEIQFRVFAVNYDGTLVEPNGRAFRVYVGAQTTNASVTGNATFTGYQKLETGWLPLSGALKDGDGSKIIDITNKTINMKDADGKYVGVRLNYLLAANAEGTVKPTKDSEVKYIKFSLDESQVGSNGTHTLEKWANEGTLTATIEDTNKPAFNSIAVTLKKSMPTVEEAQAIAQMSKKWKANQLVDDTFTAYLYPYSSATEVSSKDATADWNAEARCGYKYMNDAISGLTDKYSISIANAAVNASDNNKITSPVAANANYDFVFNISASLKDLVDNKTPHTSTVYYNFGRISSNETIYNEANKDYKIPVQTYNTVFACALNESVQTYEWKDVITAVSADGKKTPTYTKVNEITYGADWNGKIKVYDDVDASAGNKNIMKFLVATNKYDNDMFGKSLYTLLADATKKYLSVVSVTLTSDSNGNQDYFEPSIAEGLITFKALKTDAGTNPTADVPSTLTIKLKDAFGHEHVINMPFTVKRK